MLPVVLVTVRISEIVCKFQLNDLLYGNFCFHGVFSQQENMTEAESWYLGVRYCCERPLHTAHSKQVNFVTVDEEIS